MDKILSETTNFCVEIMNSKRQVKRKLGHVVQFAFAVDINVMSNLSSYATGNHEIMKQGRANPVLFVSSPNKRQGRTDQFPFYLYSLQFFLVENAGQSSFPPNQTVDLQKEQDSVSALRKARGGRKLDP